MSFKQILLIVIAVLVLIVILQNTGEWDFQILIWKIRMSRIIMLSFLLLAGFLLGLLAPSSVIRQEKIGRRK